MTFQRPGSVTYTMPSSGSTTVTISLPPGSTWTSGLHWHESHTEFLQISRGTARITLHGCSRNYTAEDGVIRVEKYQIHEWKRAETEGSVDEELVVKEWTDPADGEKEVFFRNLNSVILDAAESKPVPYLPIGWWITWQILVICYGLDNFPVFVSSAVPRRFVTYTILSVATWLGVVVGLKDRYPRYTPQTITAEGKKYS